ncbi:MAG: hypothetical protein AAFQ71_11435 [Planctomycetota bacterium]
MSVSPTALVNGVAQTINSFAVLFQNVSSPPVAQVSWDEREDGKIGLTGVVALVSLDREEESKRFGARSNNKIESTVSVQLLDSIPADETGRATAVENLIETARLVRSLLQTQAIVYTPQGQSPQTLTLSYVESEIEPVIDNDRLQGANQGRSVVRVTYLWEDTGT